MKHDSTIEIIDKYRSSRVGFILLARRSLMLALGMLGTQELVIILIIVILVFGVNKIPQLGKGLGEGIRNFKSSIKEISEDPDKKQSEKEKD